MAVRLVRGNDPSITELSLPDIIRESRNLNIEDRDIVLKDVITIFLNNLNIPSESIVNIHHVIFKYSNLYLCNKKYIYLTTMYNLLKISGIGKDMVDTIYNSIVNILNNV